MLAIVGASGKLGSATLTSLLDLLPAGRIVCCTSSQPNSEKWQSLERTGVTVRHATFDDSKSLEKAFVGCDKLFLVSSPRISLDFDDAPNGSGREKDHIAAIDSATKAGVKHVYYSSLAFQNPSKAGVMQAHIRTEHYLSSKPNLKYTIIREGIYNESWPLYLGYYDPKSENRSEIVVGGDGPISWTSIPDLGMANAIILSAPSSEYAGRTLYLSATEGAKTLAQIASLVTAEKGSRLSLRVLGREEHEQYYINERNMPGPAVKWWSTTYDALNDRECLIRDSTLENLLGKMGRKPKPIEETLKEMVERPS